MINPGKLATELRTAGVLDATQVNSAGRVSDGAGVDISARSDVAAVLAAHNPSPTLEQRLAANGWTLREAAMLVALRRGVGAPKWAKDALAAAETEIGED